MNWTSRLVKATSLSFLIQSSGLFDPTLAFGQGVSPEKQAHDVGVEAYEYAYPLVLLGLTRVMALSGDDKASNAPLNKFAHRRQFASASDHKVVRPNLDVLYSVAWVDVSKEPVVVSVPDTQDRFYFLTMLDGWSEAFASPGKRTTGTQPGNFAIVGPRWKGTIPAGVTRLNSATNFVWIVGKIEAKQTNDIVSVNTIQNGFKISLLSNYIKAAGGAESEIAAQPASVSRETGRIFFTNQPPIKQIADMNAAKFFSTFSELLFSNPPHKEDVTLVTRLKSIGIEPGAEFHFDKLSPQVAAALEGAVTDAKAAIDERASTISTSENGWILDRKIAGIYGANYLDRAAVAKIGAGLNRLEDAVYPSCNVDAQGQPLTGSKNYVLHFDRAQLPPVKAFWSLSLYNSQGFFVKNALNRYAVGDRDSLKLNGDGSLDIYIQHDVPGSEKQTNWLPSPEEDFNLLLRMYFPKTTVLNGAWSPPAVKVFQTSPSQAQ